MEAFDFKQSHGSDLHVTKPRFHVLRWSPHATHVVFRFAAHHNERRRIVVGSCKEKCIEIKNYKVVLNTDVSFTTLTNAVLLS